MSVAALQSANELVASLPLAHVSVVLFTALWSFDSGASLAALERVAARFPPPAQPPHVAFYRLSVAIGDVDAAPPPPRPPPAGLRAALFRAPPRDRAAYNATRALPFFPALRAFSGANTGGAAGVPPETFTDSLTEPDILDFVLRAAARAVADLEHGLAPAAPAPPAPSAPSAPPAPRPAADAHADAARPAEPADPRAVAVRRARDAVELIASRRPEPRQISPDAFTKLFFRYMYRDGDVVHRGAVLFAPGGAETLHHSHIALWRRLVQATDQYRAPDGRPWTAACIDTARYEEVAQRYGVSPTRDAPKLLLIDSIADNVQVSDPPGSVETAVALLHSFSHAHPGSRRARTLQRRPLGLPIEGELVEHVYGDALHSVTSRWLGRNVVWIVVHQPWCGFSQRVLANFQEFARRSSVSRAFATTDIDNLPDDVDRLVDGFPTILRAADLVEEGSFSFRTSCKTSDLWKCIPSWEGQKGFAYVEYTGDTSVDGLCREAEKVSEYVSTFT